MKSRSARYKTGKVESRVVESFLIGGNSAGRELRNIRRTPERDFGLRSQRIQHLRLCSRNLKLAYTALWNIRYWLHSTEEGSVPCSLKSFDRRKEVTSMRASHLLYYEHLLVPTNLISNQLQYNHGFSSFSNDPKPCWNSSTNS
jgi:hypothetical protein